ncbi:MAG: hypothetical protein WCQ69_06260 [Bacteroidales bacterium]|jgi:hypothetical protein|nr:hypothetical protein [Bacteroidales bacterium]MDD2263543.1 hypothetical protein [Bacteroidales bacterium]MDD2830666.1 hypothetical protein [Bacteroidales bacterium]MDD3207865.1 hypothetical protein [Bacteroidales bacterium]MDD3696627.1 hypothetical protein [Bacteroidales bacterium]
MAFRISFFSTPKHRVFNYKPIYWDPEKEEFEARVRRAREKVASQKKDEEKPYVPGSSIRGSFSKRHEVERRYPKRQKLIRVIIILTIVVIMIMALYFTKVISYFYNIF